MMDRIKGAAHHTQSMAGIGVEIWSARQPGGPPQRRRHLVSRRLAVRASFANGQGDEQQT
jgi:hypothetical protein